MRSRECLLYQRMPYVKDTSTCLASFRCLQSWLVMMTSDACRQSDAPNTVCIRDWSRRRVCLSAMADSALVRGTAARATFPYLHLWWIRLAFHAGNVGWHPILEASERAKRDINRAGMPRHSPAEA